MKFREYDTLADEFMNGLAVAQALEKAWGKDDHMIDTIVRAVNIHENLLFALKELHKHDRQKDKESLAEELADCCICKWIAYAEGHE